MSLYNKNINKSRNLRVESMYVRDETDKVSDWFLPNVLHSQYKK